MLHLDPLWDELFPAEQARIVQLLVERVDVRMHGVEVRLRPNGLGGLVREVAGSRRARVKRATLSADGETITVHIPMTFRKRGGRKLVVTPDGAAWAPRPRVDNAMVKALARAFRWRRMLDDGVHATLEDLARAKGVARPYVSRVLRLTLLAPEIVEAILDGRQPAELQLDDLLEGFRWSGGAAQISAFDGITVEVSPRNGRLRGRGRPGRRRAAPMAERSIAPVGR